MRFRHTLLVLFALLAHPAVSAAGPIDISYYTSWNMLTHPGQHDPGPLDFTLDPGGNVSWTGRGGGLALGTVHLGPSPGPRAPDSYVGHTGFEVSVLVTDQMTGESVDLALPGAAVDMWDHRSWDGRWMNTRHQLELGDPFAGNESEVSGVLGDVRYTLTVRPEDEDQTGVYTLLAETTHAPEPGTLLLAALALAPVGLRAWRRK